MDHHVRTSSLSDPRSSDILMHSFTTTTPPCVSKSTHIVAAMHPGLSTAAQALDGWFVSDYYAFNTLFHGLGASQTWLSVTSPEALIAKHGNFTHGALFEDRKVVLSDRLLRQKKITPVTTVRPGEIIDRFLRAVKRATEAAKRERGHVLLLLFCHSVDKEHFALDAAGKQMLTVSMLRDVMEPCVPVCLLTTACSSGGWSVCTDINSTSTESSSVQMRYPGTVFVGSVIQALTANTSELLDNNGGAQTTEMQSMQPEAATLQQTAAYNALCKAIWVSCRGRHRRWHEHAFTFTAQGDEWEKSWNVATPSTLADYEARWNALETYPYQSLDEANSPNVPTDDDLFIGPLIKSLYHNRLAEMVRLWLETCPGDQTMGHGPLLSSFMKQCAETGLPYYSLDYDEDDPICHYNVVAIMQYRSNVAVLAENILETVGLPRPSDKSCLMWDKLAWEEDMMAKHGISRDDVRDQTGPPHDFFWMTKLLQRIEPAAEQGPQFFRFQQYLAAAVVEGQLEASARTRVLNAIEACIGEAEDFYKRAALDSPEVQERGREWLGAIGW